MISAADKELRAFLEEKYLEYNSPSFIENDPISIPHQFDKKEDIEISGFLVSAIAWGVRKSIIKSADLLMKEMGYFPYEFIVNGSEKEFSALDKFVYRTFNGTDTLFFLRSLKNIYANHHGLENVFNDGYKKDNTIYGSLHHFRNIFIETEHDKRSEKHIADVSRKASCKRLNMFLRWMVRKDRNGVDFGLWKEIPASALMLPLDVHSGNVSRALGLLKRKQNDWQAVEEITQRLRDFDKDDPVKYDFALFGLGVNKDLK